MEVKDLKLNFYLKYGYQFNPASAITINSVFSIANNLYYYVAYRINNTITGALYKELNIYYDNHLGSQVSLAPVIVSAVSLLY